MQNTETYITRCTNILLLHLITVLALFAPVQLFANDSTSSVSAGGITLLKNENIRMLQEVLEISTKKVTVHYRFFNESDQDIHTTVAFPLPEFEWNPEVEEHGRTDTYTTFRSFKSWTNGKPVQIKQARKALMGNKDVTERLRKIGLNEKQIFETFDGSKEISKSQEKELAELYRKMTGKKSFWLWTISETLYWEQTFPKQQEIEVIHEYNPSVGLNLYVGNDTVQLSDLMTHHNDRACLSKETASKLSKMYTSKGLSVSDIRYVLGTGKNWKGPIGSFTLRLTKDSQYQLISLCFPGTPRKINETSLEFTQNNYTPQDRLDVYFFTPQQ